MSNVNVSLSEWETLRPERGSILAGRNLENDANRELADVWPTQSVSKYLNWHAVLK